MTKKIKLRISSRLLKKKTRRNSFNGAKHCRFCSDPSSLENIDYKNAMFLRNFLSERGKILPSRISGNRGKHQRLLSKQIRKSRTMALIPYTASN